VEADQDVEDKTQNNNGQRRFFGLDRCFQVGLILFLICVLLGILVAWLE
jgi:hypothetical protein